MNNNQEVIVFVFLRYCLAHVRWDTLREVDTVVRCFEFAIFRSTHSYEQERAHMLSINAVKYIKQHLGYGYKILTGIF